MNNIDHETARELTLCAVNRSLEVDHYRIHLARSTMPHSRLASAWAHIAEIEARQYVKEYCEPGRNVHDIFNPETILAVAIRLATHYREMAAQQEDAA